MLDERLLESEDKDYFRLEHEAQQHFTEEEHKAVEYARFQQMSIYQDLRNDIEHRYTQAIETLIKRGLPLETYERARQMIDFCSEWEKWFSINESRVQDVINDVHEVTQ